MRRLLLAGMMVGSMLGSMAAAARQQDPAPLPNVEELRLRAVENNKKTTANREKYLCREQVTERMRDGKGNVKKTNVVERESFFVHGRAITQTVSKNGKPLSADEQKKQQEHVRKEIEEALKPNGKKNPNSINISDLIRQTKLTNERRVMVAGRPTIVFDAGGDPARKTSSIEEKIIQAMAGTVSIDEQSGTPQDVRVQGMHDVKVAGGMMANIHKGFQLHVRFAPQPDGVWVLQQVEGAGDARIGLFLHPSEDFQEKTEGCKLYNVEADAVVKAK